MGRGAYKQVKNTCAKYLDVKEGRGLFSGEYDIVICFSVSVCDEPNASLPLTCQQCNQPCPESGYGISEDSSFPAVEISKKEELNSSSKRCIDMGNNPITAVTAATAVEESVNTSVPGECNNKGKDLEMGIILILLNKDLQH